MHYRSFFLLGAIALVAVGCGNSRTLPPAKDADDAQAQDIGTDSAPGSDAEDAGPQIDAGDDAAAQDADAAPLDSADSGADEGAQDAEPGTDSTIGTDAEADGQDSGVDGMEADTTPVCVPGDCDDGNPCTDDTCDKALGCVNLANTATCSDGDACTLGDTCAGGACLPGTVTACDDGNVCTDDSCDKALGCVNLANTATCADGDACTLGDTCAGGACLPGTVTACDDGNVCSDDTCDKALGCVHLANTATCSDGAACTLGDICAGGQCQSGAPVVCKALDACHKGGTCDPASGTCSNPAKPEGATCDDGDVCTEQESCASGKCGEWLGIQDQIGGAVSWAAFLGSGWQSFTAGQTGKFEAIGLYRMASKSHTIGVQVFAGEGDGGAKLYDGTAYVPEGGGDWKLYLEPGKRPVLTAGQKYTFKVFDPENTSAIGFAVSDNSNPYPKGQWTDGNLDGQGYDLYFRTYAELNIDCGDGNACTADSCVDAKGCVHAPQSGSICSDGDACTSGDQCAQGVCVPSGKLACDDKNPCTDDSCDKSKGCVYLANTATCTDGSVCTKDDGCGAGKCGGTPLSCTDGEPCTDDGCDEVKGCTFVNNTASCDDGDACSKGDQCGGGSCGMPAAGVVDQGQTGFNTGNIISQGWQSFTAGTSGKLASVTIFKYGPSAVPAMTFEVFAGVGASGIPLYSGSVTLPGFDEGPFVLPIAAEARPSVQVGKSYTFRLTCPPATMFFSKGLIGNPYPGGSWGGDTAFFNYYVDQGFDLWFQTHVAPTDWCEDGNACTDDSCDKVQGCMHLANAATCTDGDACTKTDLCQGGKCVGTVPALCTAPDDCHTTGTCDAKTGCSNPAKANGTACDDGSVCTSMEKCSEGSCVTQTAALDQQQTQSDKGLNVLQGWQSFTPSVSGKVTALFLYKNGISGSQTVTIDFFAGNGSAGTLLSTFQAGLPDTIGAVGISVPAEKQPGVLAGKAYTFRLTDPSKSLGTVGGTGNPYPGGAWGGDTVYGDYFTNMNFDLWFKLYIWPTTVCDDGVACTKDSCNAKDGCVFAPDAKACDDGNACTDDACDAVQGCTHANTTATCDDGNACTAQDTCKEGACATIPVVCPGSDTCHVGLCDAKTGSCTGESAKPDGVACEDGVACTASETCKSAVCTAPAVFLLDQDQKQKDSTFWFSQDWQSFTAGKTGLLAGIGLDIEAWADVGPDAMTALDIFQGEGVDGVHVSSSSSPIPQWVYGEHTFLIPSGQQPFVEAGKVYTFRFKFPFNSFKVWAHYGNPYAGGKWGSYVDKADVWFKSYVFPQASCDDSNVCTADSCDAKNGCVHKPVSGSCGNGQTCSGGVCGG